VLPLSGLKEPYVFKKLVDSKILSSTDEATSPISSFVELASNASTLETDHDSTVMAEIRDELRRHNDLLQSQRDAAV